MKINTLDDIELLSAPERGFDESEFAARIKNAQQKMAALDIDLILLTTEPDIRYFSGFLTQFWQSPTRTWFLLVPQSGKPVAVIPSIGAECMGKTWISDIRTWAAPHQNDDGVSLLADTINELAGNSPKLGLMKRRETHLRMPLSDFEQLKTQLPNAEYKDASPIVQGLRSVKSENEIDKIRHAAQIGSSAFDLVPQILSKGMSEIEAFRAFKIACLKLGADDPAFLVGGSAQGGYGDIISPPSGKPLSDGDVLILDVGCIWDGYFCDFDRNFAIGEVDEKALEAHRITWDATQAGIEAAKPGATCADLFNAMNDVMAPHAIASDGEVGRLGHGLGMQLTEFPSHTSWDQTVLQAGMVLTIEPGYAFSNGKMMVHEENIVVREDEAELLTTRASREMPQIG